MGKNTIPMPRGENTAQVTLKTYFKEEEITKVMHHYKTDLHEITLTNTRIDTFLRQIKASTKHGSKYNNEQKHMKMCAFIMSRAKPLQDKMNGVEWEASMRSLLHKIFKEDWDRDDFDNTAIEKDAVAPKVPA